MNRRGGIRASKLKIDDNIFKIRSNERKSDRNSRIEDELNIYQLYKRLDLVQAVATHSQLPSSFYPVYGENRRHYDIYPAARVFDSGSYLVWMMGCFNANSKLLSDLCSKRQDVNTYVLTGMYEQAITRIKEINKMCKSWWAIFFEAHIRKELLNEDIRSFTESLEVNFVPGYMDLKISDLKIISESNSIEVFINSLLGRIKEYRSSGVEHAIANGTLDSCMFLPINYDSSRAVDIDILHYYCFESLFDQYIVFKDVISESIVSGGFPEEIRPELIKLANKINDVELLAILDNANGTTKEIEYILELYTKGDYYDVIREIDNLKKKSSKAIFGLIDIYSRSAIYAGYMIPKDTFFDEISLALSAILKCDKDTPEKINYLRKICVKFKSELWAKSLNYHMTSALSNYSNSVDLEKVRLLTLELGELNTPKAAVYDYSLTERDCDSKEVPIYRRMKYLPDDNFKDNIKRTTFPILSDYLKFKSRYLMQQGHMLGAIRFAIEEYLSNEVSFYHIPFEDMCIRINEIKRDGIDDYISCLIAYDIYNREGNGIFEESKVELFEDLMDFCGTHKPSLIFKDFLFTKEQFYFLKNICIPSQLDNLITFSSNDEVVLERVAILDILINSNFDSGKQLRQEKDNVLETLFSEKLRAKIESGKLYFDIQALDSQRRHIYNTFYEQAKTINGGVSLEPLTGLNDKSTNDIFIMDNNSALASNQKTQFLFQVYTSAVYDFALNEDFGLDKYLSAEIRHIVFITQLRSCFEKTHLLTSQDNGIYQSNYYWIDKYNYARVNKAIIGSIDEAFKNFSKKIDNILSEVNDCFKVEVNTQDSNKVFDFLSYHSRLVRISNIAEIAKDDNEFFVEIFNYMQSIAVEGAKSAKELISGHLTNEVILALDSLEEELNTAKGGVAAVELMQEIKTARSLFTQEVELVLNWFKFVGVNDTYNYEPLNVVIDATISSFESIYNHKYTSPTYHSCENEILLNYREARALFISFFTALENSYKYGVEQCPTEITINTLKDKVSIDISNKVDDERQVCLLDLINTEKNKWSPVYSSLNREEGGTGLYKIYSILNSLSKKFGFNIKSKDNYFIAEIEVKN